ncbi:MAG: hypothetical protein MRY72_01615, partial [Aquisalinus sp.]|nr:hypothetical protein [Aquisalinus sp.]
MKKLMMSAAVLALAACAENTAETETSAPKASPEVTETITTTTLDYPETVTVDQTDDFFGVTVADPYRWLEDDVRVNADVATWVEAQNAVTDDYLETLPNRAAIETRLGQLWDYEKFTLPNREGGKYFFRRNDGLQNQYVYYVQESLDAEPRVLIDPNGWSEDGATALSAAVPSPDGSHVLYSIQDGGTDWRTLKVLNVETGETLEDTIEWVKFSGLAWAPDGSGFFYSRYPEPEEGETFQSLNFDQKLYFHKIGDAQGDDTLIYERTDNPEISVGGYVVAKRFLIILMSKGTDDVYEIAVKDLDDPASEPVMIIEGFENDYSFVGAEGRVLYARTDRDAPRGRIVAIDLDNFAEESWQEVIPQSDNVLIDASIVGGKLVTEYMEDVKSVVRIYEMDGTAAGTVDLPGLGSASGFEGAQDESETFYSFSSYNRPTTIYRFDVATGE